MPEDVAPNLSTSSGGAPAAGHFSGSIDTDVWFTAHFNEAAREIVDFFAGDGISLRGKRVADIGCGDGITDLGLALQAQPAELVGFDVVPTDVNYLLEKATRHAGVSGLPPGLRFETCDPDRLPAEDSTFDYVVSWSAFEHISDPVSVLAEVRRILKPDGVLFIQLWPFYDSAHGTHLVDWFPEGFAQHLYSTEEILVRLGASGDQGMAAMMYEAYTTLNGISADDLHAALSEAGFRIAKLHLQADCVHLPEALRDLPPSRVGISGVKLLAIPRR